MKKKLLLLFCCTSLFSAQAAKETPIYLNEKQPIEKRVEDLMSRMTLTEKVGQMCQYVGIEHIKQAEKNATIEEVEKGHSQSYYKGLHSKQIEQMVIDGKISSFLHVVTAEECNELQKLALKSRLKIPLIIGIDAIHGNGLECGATIYPTSIGQASSFDLNLVEKLCRETAREMRAMGAQWTFNPNVEVARDARWGRVGETFGEDPYLVSKMGVASIKGYQGNNSLGNDYVIACAKHFVGGSQSVNGINGAPIDISYRTLKEIFFPPFKAASDAGVFSFMAAHNEVNGQPCHGSKWLLTDIVRKDFGFNGFIVSDWLDIERMVTKHGNVATEEEAFQLSVNAGMDMHMHGPNFLEAIVSGVEKGIIPAQRVEEACRLILEAKFRLGLFENRFVDLKKKSTITFNKEHQNTALEMARKSIVLLENKGILPLEKGKYRKIVVAGPNIDNESILGDWAYPQPKENTTTILEGLRREIPTAKITPVDFGEYIRKLDPKKIDETVSLAQKSDLAILVVGENSMRSLSRQRTCGENIDRANIDLYGIQQQLVEEVYKTGTPTIVVLVNGRPLSTKWISENIPAVLEAWEPGSMGGQAVAEVITGKVNPSAKLPISIPRSVGHIQTVYNYKLSMDWFDYVEGTPHALYEFGYGLSYTTFAYGTVKLDKNEANKNENITATIDVTNTGKRAGDEVVQLYIRDEFSSITRPVKELKDFARITLQPGETKTVSFTITPDKLQMYDANMNPVIEEGKFIVMIGSSSADKNLQKASFNITK